MQTLFAKNRTSNKLTRQTYMSVYGIIQVSTWRKDGPLISKICTIFQNVQYDCAILCRRTNAGCEPNLSDIIAGLCTGQTSWPCNILWGRLSMSQDNMRIISSLSQVLFLSLLWRTHRRRRGVSLKFWGPRFATRIHPMKQFAHNWHLPWCQCTEACYHVSFIQNIFYAPVPGVSRSVNDCSCPESTRCCGQCVIPLRWRQTIFFTDGSWPSG